jgi:hypothetical protein
LANSKPEQRTACTLAFVGTDAWIVQESFDLSISADYIGTFFVRSITTTLLRHNLECTRDTRDNQDYYQCLQSNFRILSYTVPRTMILKDDFDNIVDPEVVLFLQGQDS